MEAVMKKLSIVLFAITLSACSTPSTTSREPSSAELDLSGSRLGHATYKFFRDGPNQPAIRLYLNKVENEIGTYHAVIFEYASLPSIAPQYLASRKLPAANKFIGYLNHIGQKISAFKVIPSPKQGTYEMHPLRVQGKIIEVALQARPLLLTLSNEMSSGDLLGGASISSGSDGHVEMFFPKDDGKLHGVQYGLAKLAYEKAKLDSTWRKRFLTGPYLAAYGKLNDVVLKLSSAPGGDTATFINNDKRFNISKKRRTAVFTSPKSASLEGTYSVTEPIDGMFVLWPNQEGQLGAENVTGRIGLFIDVFDASQALNQDVVEVAFVNPNDPEDFLMYYEHPDNGEGAGSRR